MDELLVEGHLEENMGHLPVIGGVYFARQSEIPSPSESGLMVVVMSNVASKLPDERVTCL